jgi:hypothetical protein
MIAKVFYKKPNPFERKASQREHSQDSLYLQHRLPSLSLSLSLSTVDQEVGRHCQGSRTPEATVTPSK